MEISRGHDPLVNIELGSKFFGIDNLVCEFKGRDQTITTFICETCKKVEFWVIHLESNKVKDLLQMLISDLLLTLLTFGKDLKDSQEV